jgi:hypothetical protein
MLHEETVICYKFQSYGETGSDGEFEVVEHVKGRRLFNGFKRKDKEFG